jgi:hypothetical protein
MKTHLAKDQTTTSSRTLWFVRYGIGALTIVVGIVCLALNVGGFGLEAFFGFAGAGLSIVLLNQLHRLGQQSDQEREDHEKAWSYFERYGHWPDEAA